VVDVQGCTALKDFTPAGLLAFRQGDAFSGRWGLADRTGQVLVKPTWSFVGRSKYDGAYVHLVSGLAKVKGGVAGKTKWGVVDEAGKRVVPLDWDAVEPSAAGIWVKKDTLWGLLSRTGKTLVPPTYTSVSTSVRVFAHSPKIVTVTVRKGKRRCYYGAAGKKLLCGFEELEPLSAQFFKAQMAMQIGLYSASTGKRILARAIHGKTPYCFGRSHARAGAHPVAVQLPSGAVRFGLVGAKGALTPFRYQRLGCFAHGLAPFTLVNQQAKPAP